MDIVGQIVFVCAQSCPTLCNCMNCSLRGSSVHGIFPGKNTVVLFFKSIKRVSSRFKRLI